MSSTGSLDVYVYGMTVWTTAHRLEGPFPQIDTYGEIAETHQFPGGEGGNAALILANLGYTTRLAGPHLGTETRDPILDFYGQHLVDCSELRFDPSYAGVKDLVLVAEGSRTVFGWFGAYFRGIQRWSPPVETSVQEARCVSIDPFFGSDSEAAAEMCCRFQKPYVTMDCPPDSYLHEHASASVISAEFLLHHFPTEERESLLDRYTASSSGLVIFTSGSREILYGRRGRRGSVEAAKVATQAPSGQGTRSALESSMASFRIWTIKASSHLPPPLRLVSAEDFLSLTTRPTWTKFTLCSVALSPAKGPLRIPGIRRRIRAEASDGKISVRTGHGRGCLSWRLHGFMDDPAR